MPTCIKCFECQDDIGAKCVAFTAMRRADVPESQALETLGLKKECCRRMVIGDGDASSRKTPLEENHPTTKTMDDESIEVSASQVCAPSRDDSTVKTSQSKRSRTSFVAKIKSAVPKMSKSKKSEKQKVVPEPMNLEKEKAAPVPAPEPEPEPIKVEENSQAGTDASENPLGSLFGAIYKQLQEQGLSGKKKKKKNPSAQNDKEDPVQKETDLLASNKGKPVVEAEQEKQGSVAPSTNKTVATTPNDVLEEEQQCSISPSTKEATATTLKEILEEQQQGSIAPSIKRATATTLKEVLGEEHQGSIAPSTKEATTPKEGVEEKPVPEETKKEPSVASSTKKKATASTPKESDETRSASKEETKKSSRASSSKKKKAPAAEDALALYQSVFQEITKVASDDEKNDKPIPTEVSFTPKTSVAGSASSKSEKEPALSLYGSILKTLSQASAKKEKKIKNEEDKPFERNEEDKPLEPTLSKQESVRSNRSKENAAAAEIKEVSSQENSLVTETEHDAAQTQMERMKILGLVSEGEAGKPEGLFNRGQRPGIGAGPSFRDLVELTRSISQTSKKANPTISAESVTNKIEAAGSKGAKSTSSVAEMTAGAFGDRIIANQNGSASFDVYVPPAAGGKKLPKSFKKPQNDKMEPAEEAMTITTDADKTKVTEEKKVVDDDTASCTSDSDSLVNDDQLAEKVSMSCSACGVSFAFTTQLIKYGNCYGDL